MNQANTPIVPLPTGSWLTWERKRRLLHLSDVATAVGRYHQTISTIERLDRVIPPGWFDILRSLGMQIYEPTWPKEMATYSGAAWAHEINTRVGLRHSAFWWSRQLGVSEEAVLEVLRSDKAVPQSWLLKLAELGVEVPSEVKETLRCSESLLGATPSNPARPAPAEIAAEARTNGAAVPPRREPAPPNTQTRAAATSAGAVPKQPPIPATPLSETSPSRPRERTSIYFRWSEDDGLHFSVSASLLDQLPGTFKELLLVLSDCGVIPRMPSRNSQAGET